MIPIRIRQQDADPTWSRSTTLTVSVHGPQRLHFEHPFYLMNFLLYCGPGRGSGSGSSCSAFTIIRIGIQIFPSIRTRIQLSKIMRIRIRNPAIWNRNSCWSREYRAVPGKAAWSESIQLVAVFPFSISTFTYSGWEPTPFTVFIYYTSFQDNYVGLLKKKLIDNWVSFLTTCKGLSDTVPLVFLTDPDFQRIRILPIFYSKAEKFP